MDGAAASERASLSPVTLPKAGPVELRKLADVTADRILARISSGELAIGERLPPERALVAELGVSRTVVREALSSLEALGIIESRTTLGRFVANGSSARSRTLVAAWMRQHADAIVEIDEIRSVLEEHAIVSMNEWDAYDAAGRARALLLDHQEAVKRGDAVLAAEYDADFHRLLVSYTNNVALRSLVDGLIDNARQAALAVYSLAEAAQASLEQHRAIIQALAGGDPALAGRLAREHMTAAARLLLQIPDDGTLH
jgi:GntR family transcriptional regulator, transcriptional repressor for pyruvate dehydrogenase complex